MSSKEELGETVKAWIKLDNEINLLKNEVKERNNKKKQVSDNLVRIMKENKIDCFDMHDGVLVYKKRSVKKTITAKTLLASLQSYLKSQPELAADLTRHVLETRDVVEKHEIKMKYDK
jgi:hypothetical protein